MYPTFHSSGHIPSCKILLKFCNIYGNNIVLPLFNISFEMQSSPVDLFVFRTTDLIIIKLFLYPGISYNELLGLNLFQYMVQFGYIN